jgi:hypothetical protein
MKNLSRVLLAASVALSLAACSSTSNDSSSAYAKTDEGDDGMVCKLEKKIGSNRMHRVCYSVEEREQMREAGREAWTRMQGRNETGGGDL